MDLKDAIDVIERFVPEHEGTNSIATSLVIISVGVGLLMANIVTSNNKRRRIY